VGVRALRISYGSSIIYSISILPRPLSYLSYKRIIISNTMYSVLYTGKPGVQGL
jgi:hypothetical protein